MDDTCPEPDGSTASRHPEVAAAVRPSLLRLPAGLSLWGVQPAPAGLTLLMPAVTGDAESLPKHGSGVPFVGSGMLLPGASHGRGGSVRLAALGLLPALHFSLPHSCREPAARPPAGALPCPALTIWMALEWSPHAGPAFPQEGCLLLPDYRLAAQSIPHWQENNGVEKLISPFWSGSLHPSEQAGSPFPPPSLL